MPMIYQITNRRALYLTTIVTAASTVLLPKQTSATPTYSISNLTLAALPIVPQLTSTASACSIITNNYYFAYSILLTTAALPIAIITI